MTFYSPCSHKLSDPHVAGGVQAVLRCLRLRKWGGVGAGSMGSEIRQTWVQSHFINSGKVTWGKSPPLFELSLLKMSTKDTDSWGRAQTRLGV